MVSTRSSGRLFLLIFSVGMIFSCKLDVPIKEMTEARSAIAKARQVMAEKYDPDNLNKSIKELYTGHDFLVRNDVPGAKKAAEASRLSALAAISASLPRAAEDSLTEAKAVYQEADKLLAESFAPEQFAGSKKSIDEAEKLKNEQNLLDSFMKSREAVSLGSEAKAIALKKVPQINEGIDKMKIEINDLKSQNISEPQKQELPAVSEKLDKALQLVSQYDLKQAAPLIREAEDAINKIKAAARKKSAKDRIAELRQDAEALRKKRGSEFAGEDIDGVVALLNEADSLVEQDKPDAARNKISDAEKSLALAQAKTTKGLAIEKSKSVGKFLADTRKMDTQNKFQNEINTASSVYAEGKKLLESESYKESLAKFEDAEALLKSISVAREKGYLEKKGMKELEGKMIYKVVYNRSKRDCLWRIAHKVYKRAQLWPLIYMANKDQIKDPDIIFPGQSFIIPEIPAKKKMEFIEKREGREGKEAPVPDKPEEKKAGAETGEKV